MADYRLSWTFCIASEAELTRLSATFARAVKRLYDAGIFGNYLTIGVDGPQGIGKTTFIKKFLPAIYPGPAGDLASCDTARFEIDAISQAHGFQIRVMDMRTDSGCMMRRSLLNYPGIDLVEHYAFVERKGSISYNPLREEAQIQGYINSQDPIAFVNSLSTERIVEIMLEDDDLAEPDAQTVFEEAFSEFPHLEQTA